VSNASAWTRVSDAVDGVRGGFGLRLESIAAGLARSVCPSEINHRYQADTTFHRANSRPGSDGGQASVSCSEFVYLCYAKAGLDPLTPPPTPAVVTANEVTVPVVVADAGQLGHPGSAVADQHLAAEAAAGAAIGEWAEPNWRAQAAQVTTAVGGPAGPARPRGSRLRHPGRPVGIRASGRRGDPLQATPPVVQVQPVVQLRRSARNHRGQTLTGGDWLAELAGIGAARRKKASHRHGTITVSP
jgi:hypothetical protein